MQCCLLETKSISNLKMLFVHTELIAIFRFILPSCKATFPLIAGMIHDFFPGTEPHLAWI